MRATPTAVSAVPAALAALLLLAACDGAGGDEEGDGKRKNAACSVRTVDVEAGPASTAPAAGDIGEVPVTLTNRGAACTLDGFPEVTLTGAGDPSAVDVPPAEGARAQKLTLAKGGSASFTVAYERGAPGDGAFDAGNLRVRLPGDAGSTRSRLFPWSYGPVAGDGRGRHEVSVSAYQRAGD